MTAGADLRLLRAAVFAAVCVTLSAAGHSLTAGGRIPLWSAGLAFVLVFAVAAPLAGRERSLPGIAALLAAGQLALHTLFACERPAARGAAAHTAGAHGGAAQGVQGSGADVRSLAAQLLCREDAAGGMSESRARRVLADAGIDPARIGGHAGHAGHAGHGGHAGHAAPAGHGGHAGHTGHTADQAAGAAASGADSPLECLRTAAHAALSLFDGPMLLGHLLAALVLGWFLYRGEAALWRLVRLSARTARTAVHHVRASFGAAVACLRALRGRTVPRMPRRTGSHDPDAHGTPRSVLLHHSVTRRGPPRGRQQSYALAA